jgi:hypothetical protein
MRCTPPQIRSETTTVTDAERVDALRQTDETTPLANDALDAIRARNEQLREVPWDVHDGSGGFGCIPCQLVGGVSDVTALLADRDHLADQLAEERASHNPLLRCTIVKASPIRDLYIGWSSIVEAPTGMWTRAEALAYGFPRSRLDRADRTGTSSMVPGSGQWDDTGFIAEQRGWLRRDRIADYAQALFADDENAAWDLLEPFEGETEVRRG